MERLRRATQGTGPFARPLALLLAVPCLVACAGAGDARRAQQLFDGSRAPTTPRVLAFLPGRVVMTRARSVHARQIEPGILRACLRLVAPARLAAAETIVQRGGIDGASLTFRGGGPWVRGCDAGAGPKGQAGLWCGGAVGRIRPDASLFDPRLDLACRDAQGRQIGFAWVDTAPRARYVVVESGDGAEIYPTAGMLPVRVTTADVSSEASSATFRIAQYAYDGKPISSETLRAVVAG